MIFALVLALKPWVVARCTGPAGKPVRVSQSGFQVAIGDVSVPSGVETELARAAKMGQEPGAPEKTKCPSCGEILQMPQDAPSWMPSRCPRCGELFNPTPSAPMPLAPLVVVFLSLTVSAAVSSCIIRSVFARTLFVGGLAAGALAVLAIQVNQGLPLEGGLRAAFAPFGDDHATFSMRFTLWMWGSVFAIMIALALLGLEYVSVCRMRAQVLKQRVA
jgi:hypothetical protein